MSFQTGKSGNPNGRPKGAKNRYTEIKESFLKAFDKLGGTRGLITWVNEDPRNKRAFYEMVVSLLPKKTEMEFENPPRVDNIIVADQETKDNLLQLGTFLHS